MKNIITKYLIVIILGALFIFLGYYFSTPIECTMIDCA